MEGNYPLAPKVENDILRCLHKGIVKKKRILDRSNNRMKLSIGPKTEEKRSR